MTAKEGEGYFKGPTGGGDGPDWTKLLRWWLYIMVACAAFAFGYGP